MSLSLSARYILTGVCSALITPVAAAVSGQAATVTVPPGLAPGSSYRLIYLTSGSRDGQSTVIADYNAFVTAEAAAVPALAALGTTWTAVASTSAVGAQDNTNTLPASGGVGIYTLNGLNVATNNTDLWDGRINTPITDSTGTVSSGQALSGTDAAGNHFSGPLGANGMDYASDVSSTTFTWISQAAPGISQFTSYRMYAMSGVLIVPDYQVTTTGNAIVVTDVAGNGDTLTVSEPSAGNIKFAAAGRTFSVDGGASILGDSGTISRTSVTSITVNAAAGADIINVGAFTGTLPSLTINGGIGNDTVNLNGSIAFAVDTNLDVDLQNDDATPGADQIVIGAGTDLITSGSGAITMKASTTVNMTAGSGTLRTENGDITLEGNQQATPQPGAFYGVVLSGPGSRLVEATGSGNIVMKGRGGVSGTFGVGIAIEPATVRTNTGNITMVGTGAQSAANFGSGIQLGLGTVESTGGGSIDLTGTGAGTGLRAKGINFAGFVRTTGAGAITLTGTGSSTGSGSENYGVDLHDDTAVTIDGSGLLTVNATGGANASPAFHTATGTNFMGYDGVNPYSGNIIVNADSMSIANAVIRTTGPATLRQKTNGTLINLGAADSAGLLGLTDAELDQINTGTLAIGDANSGAITISSLISPANYKTLDIQNGVSFAATGGFASDVTSATVYEKIKANGAVSISTSASLTVTAFGGFVPAASDTFTILDNTSASTTTGNFSGKPGGALIAIGGVNKVLGYAGGTGNDVVLNAASSNADLANLTTTAGALTFDSAVTSYTAGVPNTISSITMTPTAAQGNATIKVNGVTVTSGSPSAAIPLNPGANTVTVLVTAQDGVTTKTYTLAVDRLGVVATGAPSAGRSEGVSILLNDGRVLVAGGSNLASAELYDPITGNWTATGSMSVPRSLPTGVLLPSGKVLVAGGFAAGGNAYASAELYDPSTGLWSATGSMNFARTAHTSTLLPDGTVLVVGGATVSNSTTQATVEIYDPGTGVWTAVASMITARDYHTATLLPNGTVLVAAGTTFGLGGGLTSCEIYDPVANTWTLTGSITGPRYAHTATLLRDGQVLLAGGFNAGFVTGAQLYDPVAGTWSSTGNLIETRAQFHSASLLPNGKVLIVGGQGNTGDLRSMEIYDPGTGLFTAAGNLSVPRKTTNATVLANGKVLITGSGAAVADLYDPVTVSAWVSTGSLGTGRTGHSTTLLADGKVLVTGGHPNNQATPTAASEVYDPTLGTWAPTGALNTARYYHSAILLPNGKVLVAGGDTTFNQGTPINSAELYDPVAGTWSVTGTMNNAGEGSLVLLANGQVLFHSLSTGGSEQYDPATGIWTAKGVVPVGARGIAVTLPDGRVLSVGASKAALYDPTTGLWALAVTPNSPNNRGEGGSLTLCVPSMGTVLMGLKSPVDKPDMTKTYS